MLTLTDSKPGEPLMLHDEPIYLEGKIIGRTTSGNFSFNFNKNLAFGYVNIDEDINFLKNKLIEIEIEKNKYKAEILIKPLNQKNYKNS
jgi:4-methylaminobutanoate oxidase (formaldehyde-forming)